MYVVCS